MRFSSLGCFFAAIEYAPLQGMCHRAVERSPEKDIWITYLVRDSTLCAGHFAMRGFLVMLPAFVGRCAQGQEDERQHGKDECLDQANQRFQQQEWHGAKRRN